MKHTCHAISLHILSIHFPIYSGIYLEINNCIYCGIYNPIYYIFMLYINSYYVFKAATICIFCNLLQYIAIYYIYTSHYSV